MSTGPSELRIQEITRVLKEQVYDVPDKKFIPRYLNLPSLNSTNQSLNNSDGNLVVIRKGETATNTLTPREQENQNESVLRGMECLFNNQFMSAKAIFEEKADLDPLSALALSSMAFLKAVMTFAEHDYDTALEALHGTYDIAYAQIEASKGPSKVISHVLGYYSYFKSKKSTCPPASNTRQSTDYVPNSVLRAHVIKAECSLQIAVMHLLKESVFGYFKCGLNIKRAYSSYIYVWQEYQKMGADHLAFMDADTLSCLQFGIGSVHLLLSVLPAKLTNAINSFGWKPDKKLGVMLLNQCIQGKRIKSSMSTVMLLVYYSTAISFAPQVLSGFYKEEAMKTLLEAQKNHPDSIVYLYFAGLMARIGLDHPLSTQSFLYSADFSRGEWVENPLTNACRFEIAINHMITGNWSYAAATFEYLYEQEHGSLALCRYIQGACYEMMGERARAVILFAEIPKLITRRLGGRLSDMDAYVSRKTALFQKSGYQNLDFFVPALEIMCLWHLFSYASHDLLYMSLKRVDCGLAAIQRCIEMEQEERMQEIATERPFPDYFNELASLYVVRAAILNSLGQPEEITLDLNWVLDHGDYIKDDTWTVPYALWEAGVSCWLLGLEEKSDQLWKRAVDCSQYDFENRLAVSLTLALNRS